MKPNLKTGPSRPFWLNVLLLIAGAGLVSYVLSLITSISMSNFFFIIGTLFLFLAVIPVFSEVGGNARAGLQARQQGKQIREAIAERENSGRYTQGTRLTFLFGISGFVCFILAIATG